MLRLVLRTATTILLTGALLLAGGQAATAAPKTVQQQAATGRTPQQTVQIARAVDPDGLASRTAALQRTAMGGVLPADQIEPLAAVLTEAQIDRFAHLTEGKRFELRVVTTTNGQLDLSATLVDADTPQRIPRGWQDNIPHCWEGWVAAHLYAVGSGMISRSLTVAGFIPGVLSGAFFGVLAMGIDWGDAC